MVTGTGKRKYGSDCWSTSAYLPTVRHDPDALAGVSYWKHIGVDRTRSLRIAIRLTK